MDTESNTNRKGFIKRAGLAVAAVFAVTSTTGTAKGSQRGVSQDKACGAMARVRTAKGAVARKA